MVYNNHIVIWVTVVLKYNVYTKGITLTIGYGYNKMVLVPQMKWYCHTVYQMKVVLFLYPTVFKCFMPF